MNWRDELVDILKSELANRKKRNPNYSLRSYAKSLSLSSGPLSEILTGTRVWNFSTDWAMNVLNKIQVDSIKRKQILLAMGYIEGAETSKIEPSKIESKIFDDWKYFAVLMAYDFPEPRNQIKSIANYFQLNLDTVVNISKDLESLGWIEKTESGFKKTKNQISFSSTMPNRNIQNFHRSHLDLAKSALDSLPVDSRDFQSLTYVGSKENFEKVKIEIQDLLKKIPIIANSGKDNDDVYRIGIQTFPMKSLKSEKSKDNL